MENYKLLSNTLYPSQYFLKLLNQNRLHNSIIISGNRGVGKTSFAFYIIKHLLSHKIGDLSSIYNIDISPFVDNLLNKHSHPNLIELSPAFDKIKNKFKEIIAVDEVRKIKQNLSTINSNDYYRIVLLNSTDLLNHNAANALLKILEEPNTNTLFILICHNYKNLIDTIKSRCLNICMQNLSNTDMVELIKLHQLEINPKYQDSLLKLAVGSFSKLQWYLQDGNMHIYKLIINTLNSSRDSSIIEIMNFIKSSNTSNANFVFEILENYILNHYNIYNIDSCNHLVNEIYTLKNQASILNLDYTSIIISLIMKIKSLRIVNI